MAANFSSEEKEVEIPTFNQCFNFTPVTEATILDHMSYLKCNNIITEHQSAYLKYHSTQMSLHKVIDDVLDGINDNCCTELCFFLPE